MENEKRWQRISYMPATPTGENGTYVTGCPAHVELSRRAAREGMVLLKNDDSLLPFKNGAKLAVFGKGQADFVKGGGGSGDTTVAYVRSLLDGLKIKEQEGRVALYSPLSNFYLENVKTQYAAGKHPGMTKEPQLPEALLRDARAFTDTAIVSICRFSGEDYDRTGAPFDGDFFLSREETAMVNAVTAAFPRVAVVLNTGGMMDTSWFRNDAHIGAALLAWQGGMEGGLAMADLLVGDACPNGRLTDTFAVDFAAYPSSENFNESKDYVEYNDDIYVGYRYFETIPGAADKVCYPFGFGLSYTTFAMNDISIREENDAFTATVTVKNTGKVAGRQVAQAYCRAPQGELGKPGLVLVGFAKTRLLAPGESETLSIAFVPYGFASYDDTGRVKQSAYVLEKGEYQFYIGSNVRELTQADFVWRLTDNRILETLTPRCVPKKLTRRIRPDGTYEMLPTGEYEGLPCHEGGTVPFEGQYPVEDRFQRPNCAWRVPTLPQLEDVRDGKISLDDFMAQLTDAQMVQLLGGQPNRGIANTFGFGNLLMYGIPNVMTADGPAGLRVLPKCGVVTTAFPCATLLACSWDEALLYEVGMAAAKEVHENGIGVWLAPAINIHRSPLCGRNFEYYSEDPLVAGKLSAALVRGVQSQGVATSVKHFACNNKETNRKESDSRLSERALRELYLKAFEINVKEASPWTVMSSYNRVNGWRASECRDLLTGILREEWGFDGLVTTDWYTRGMQPDEIAAGNDIKMACGSPEYTLMKLQSGELDRACVKASVERLLKLFLRLA